MSPETKYLADQLMQNHQNGYRHKHAAQTFPWKHRAAVSKVVTLLESQSPSKRRQASALLNHLQQSNRRLHSSFRVGITGAPGAGKSSFVERFGQSLLEGNESFGKCDWAATSDTESAVAVVCIDPSSLKTGGSILGDKTRMKSLASDPRVYVRPAASQGTLGGLAPRTDDVVRFLATEYPLVLVETVGSGQSEFEVQQSVDMLILAVPPGGGDDLQGVKKGIVEVADMIIVTKADGDLQSTAELTAGDYLGAVQFLSGLSSYRTDSCRNSFAVPEVILTSSTTGKGMEDVWKSIRKFRQDQIESGQYESRRLEQGRYWLWKNIENTVRERAMGDARLRELSERIFRDLDRGRIHPRVAAERIVCELEVS